MNPDPTQQREEKAWQEMAQGERWTLRLPLGPEEKLQFVEVVPASRAEAAEAEVERLTDALHQIALFTDGSGDWGRLPTGGAVAGAIHSVARSALSGGEEGNGS